MADRLAAPGLAGAQKLLATDEAGGRALTGLLAAQAGRALNAAEHPLVRPFLPLAPGGQMVANADLVRDLGGPDLLNIGPIDRDELQGAAAAYDQTQGNPYKKARAANEAVASGNEIATGTVNALLSPSSLLGPLGKGLQGTKAARLGKILTVADRVQNAPADALAKLAAPSRSRTPARCRPCSPT